MKQDDTHQHRVCAACCDILVYACIMRTLCPRADDNLTYGRLRENWLEAG
jgi:hypothetical protein